MTRETYKKMLIEFFHNEPFVNMAGLERASKAYAVEHFLQKMPESPLSEEVRRQLNYIEHIGKFQFDTF